MERYTESLLEPCGDFLVDWLDQNAGGNHRVAIGISGGKDSATMAGLCVHRLGRENVIGLMLPNYHQSDINDSKAIIDYLGIEHYTINIGPAYESLSKQIPGFNYSATATTNFPARLRLAVILAAAQTYHATMVNTCNRSENVVGYCTLFGDDGGSFSPFGLLTTEEVMQIGDELGLPHHLVHKTPVDGLQALSDEEKLGFTYHEINELIRYDIKGEHYDEIVAKYRANRFKLKIVNLDTFDPNREDFFVKLDMQDIGVDVRRALAEHYIASDGSTFDPNVSGLTTESPTDLENYVPPSLPEHNDF